MGLFDKLFGKKKTAAPSEKRYSYVSVYYSETRGFLVIPVGILNSNGLSIDIEPVEKLEADAEALELGEKVFAAMSVSEKHLRISEGGNVALAATGIKSYSKLNKLFRFVNVSKLDEGYEILEWLRTPEGGYAPGQGHKERTLYLPIDASPEAVGAAILKCLSAPAAELPQGRSFELLSGGSFAYNAPSDDFIDIGDAHTDAYQVFEYEADSESYMGFFFATKYEDMSAESVKKLWTQFWGELSDFEFSPVQNSVFEYSAIAATAANDKYITAYFFRDGEDWSEFLFNINMAALSTQQIECITAEFETIKDSCVIK